MKPFPKEMLYDTKADPEELHNLASSQTPAHRRALTRMRAALDTWLVETGDRGGTLEPADIVAPFVTEMDAWFGTPSWYHGPTAGHE